MSTEARADFAEFEDEFEKPVVGRPHELDGPAEPTKQTKQTKQTEGTEGTEPIPDSGAPHPVRVRPMGGSPDPQIPPPQ